MSEQTSTHLLCHQSPCTGRAVGIKLSGMATDLDDAVFPTHQGQSLSISETRQQETATLLLSFRGHW